MTQQTGLKADGCKRCKRSFVDNACPDCGRPYDDNQPDPHRMAELRAQVTDRDQTIARLTALDPVEGLDKITRDHLHRLIDMLVTLDEAGDPRQGNLLSAQMRYRKADSSGDEGSSTRWARDLHKKILATIRRALDEADAKMAGTWKPPIREQMRCVNAKCTLYGQRVDRWFGPRNSIEMTHCVRCNNRLTAA